VTDAAQPVSASVILTVPAFNSSMAFVAYAMISDTALGISATSLLMVIGIILGVMVFSASFTSTFQTTVYLPTFRCLIV